MVAESPSAEPPEFETDRARFMAGAALSKIQTRSEPA
jgi:hypothetical protein